MRRIAYALHTLAPVACIAFGLVSVVLAESLSGVVEGLTMVLAARIVMELADLRRPTSTISPTVAIAALERRVEAEREVNELLRRELEAVLRGRNTRGPTA